MRRWRVGPQKGSTWADEDVWLGGLGNDRRLIAGLRYFDDMMFWILYWIGCAMSEMRATELEKECTTFYILRKLKNLQIS